MAGLYFEILTIEIEFHHSLSRTVTEMDHILFCAMTHNLS